MPSRTLSAHTSSFFRATAVLADGALRVHHDTPPLLRWLARRFDFAVPVDDIEVITAWYTRSHSRLRLTFQDAAGARYRLTNAIENWDAFLTALPVYFFDFDPAYLDQRQFAPNTEAICWSRR
jgi:hypothetical protein